MVECTIRIPDRIVEALYGKIGEQEFAQLCKDAVASKLFLSQFAGAGIIVRPTNKEANNE